MITVTPEEWKKIPEKLKRVTPLTGLKQFYWTDKDKTQSMWITETINFTIGKRIVCK